MTTYIHASLDASIQCRLVTKQEIYYGWPINSGGPVIESLNMTEKLLFNNECSRQYFSGQKVVY